MDRKHLHIIDKFGNRKVVSWKELNQQNENSKNKYTLDMTYYREENGYMTSEQLINQLQNNGMQQENNVKSL